MNGRARWRAILVAGTLIGVSFGVANGRSPPADSPDTVRNQLNAAMMEMDTHMAVPSTGSIDAVFVAMMVPHHQGAIDMARIQLRYSHNPQIIRICEEIIVEQQQEIAVMRHAIEARP